MKRILFPLLVITTGSFILPFQIQALSNVTIKGNRFYTNNQPYFPTTNFLSSSATYPYTHVYLSNQLSESQRNNIVTELKNQGYNSIFVYTLNEGDYSGKTVTPYKSGIIGGEFDTLRLADWHNQLQNLVNNNLRPIIWLIADDSPAIRNASLTELKRYISKMVETFDDLPVMWVLALEVDEYWPRPNSKGDELGTYLASLTNTPIGIHQLSGNTDFMTASWVDFGVYQYGFGKNWETIYQDTLNKHDINGKPFISGEYDKDGNFFAQQRGLAAAFAVNAGLGNGAPSKLDSFMASLPSGMIPSRSGNLLYLKNSTITAVANMNTSNFYIEGQPQPTALASPYPTPPPATATPKPSALIKNLTVNSPSSQWYSRTNLTEGDQQYSDRSFAFDNLSPTLQHADWIQTDNDSKSASISPLATFDPTQPVDVYLLVDTRLSPIPSWLSNWELTALTARNSEPINFEVYKRSFSTGPVSLGPQANLTTSMYSIVVIPQTPQPSPTIQPTPSTKEGDYDLDRDVDFLDYFKLVTAFLADDCNLNITGAPGWCNIAIFDISRLMQNMFLN